MAGVAVAVARVVEKLQALQLGRRQGRRAVLEGVELARERAKAGVFRFVGGERCADRGQRLRRIGEHGGAEHRLELCQVGPAEEALLHFGGAAVGHLEGVDERQLRLLGEVGGAAVAKEAAGRRAVGGEVEGRRVRGIHQRRRRA
jgi:hypothetical protein